MFLLFLAPFSWGTRYARGRCSQGERLLYERDLCRSGGAGKAETAKLPGAGIGPKQCPRKCVAEKGNLPKSIRIARKSALEQNRQSEQSEGSVRGRMRKCSGKTKQYEMAVGACSQNGWQKRGKRPLESTLLKALSWSGLRTNSR